MSTAKVMRPDVLSGALTTALGVLTVGVGVYFLVLRPTLLPEDVRHTGVEASDLPPNFLAWLEIVFQTWGGFITGLGLVVIGIGMFLETGRLQWLYLGTAAGVLTAFGRFVVSNVLISSDFLWFIAALFVLAVVLAIILVYRRNWGATRDKDAIPR